MSNGPLPSKLTLLSSLPKYAFGDKVRFLGCVTSYSMVSAQLTVQHNFPKTSEMMAIVDVHLILEKLDAEKIATGQWVNIIGYITASPPKSANKTQKFEREVPTVHVQALALWSAGPLDIARYEICLVDMGKTNESAVVKREKPDTI